MTRGTRAPNRVLDLDELQEPFFAHTLQLMDALERRDSISYLHPSKRWEYPWALGRARLSRGSRVLDAGCGASIFPVFLAKLGHRVSAVDLQVPAGLDRAHGVAVQYTHGELHRLPFGDEQFDAVFCISVIEHLGHAGVPAALQELRRVLRTGGRLLITTDFYEHADAQLWHEGPGGSFPVDWGFFDAELLRRYLLEAPGLEVDGAVDLQVDWNQVRPTMRRFHGYPYTSVGVALVRR